MLSRAERVLTENPIRTQIMLLPSRNDGAGLRIQAEVCKNSIDRKLRGLSIIVVQDAPQTLTATNDAFT